MQLLTSIYLDPLPCQQMSNFFNPLPYFVNVVNGQPLRQKVDQSLQLPLPYTHSDFGGNCQTDWSWRFLQVTT